jgi:ABC-type lipoprotein export system ATPase subunit
VYFEHPSGRRVWAPLAAQGHLKAAALALLLQRIDMVGGTLFWDEPEANLNPRLIKVVAKALVALSGAGVQVFIATHSLFLTREIDIYIAKNPGKVDARFFGLRREDGKLAVHEGPEVADAGELAILDEELKQANEYMELSWRKP